MLAKAKLASSITFIALASFTIVTYDRQNMFIIQATGAYLEWSTLNVLYLAMHWPYFKIFDEAEKACQGHTI